MKPYLTAQKFRTMGFGVETEEHEDPFISSLCQRAHAMVESYCLVPRLPVVHDFRGGSVTGEQHTWRYPVGPVDVGQRKVWPYHWPITEMTDFKIKVTNTQYVEIAASELFINNSARYVEVVSLAITSHGLFQALVVPNIGLATPVCEIAYDYGFSFDETEERLMFSDGFTWRAQHQWWKTDPAPVVKKNGSTLVEGLANDYTIDYDEGTVVLNDGKDAAATDLVTATYTHTLPGEIRDAMGYIVASMHAETEHHQRGMGHLRRLSIEEVAMERQREDPRLAHASLEEVSPEAAALLASYRFDGVTVR